MKRLIIILSIMAAFAANMHAQIVAAKEGDNGKYGFVDANGNWVVNPVYSSAEWDKYGDIGTFDHDWKVFGMIDNQGRVVFKSNNCMLFTRYPKTSPFVKIFHNSKYGVGTMDGKIIVPLQYKYIEIKEEEGYTFFMLTSTDGKVGVAASDGKILVPCEYYRGEIPYSNAKQPFLLMEDFNGGMVLFSCEGKQLTPQGYSSVEVDSVAITVSKNGMEGLYTLEGQEWVPCEYASIYIDKYSNNKPYAISVTKKIDGKEKKGVFSMDGKVLVPCEYDFVYHNGNYIEVWNGEIGSKQEYGMYSKAGEVLVPCQYRHCDRLTNERERIQIFAFTDEKWRPYSFIVIRVNGEVIVPFNQYQGIEKAAENLYTIQQNGKWGLWSGDHEVMACQYDNPIKFANDVATVTKNGEASLIKNPLKDGSQILIAEAKTPTKKKEKGPAVSRYPKPDSEVDTNIPVARKQTETMFAFIICNENYPDAPVPYSLNDGRMFREYCQKTLGIPEKNINLYEDATFGNIITAVEKMKSIADAYDGEASVIFYYSGHGFPDDKQQTAYLLPIDGDAASITTTGYSLAKLYKEIASLKLKSSVVFLDACFSGAKREDEMLTSARGVAIKVKEEAPQGNMVVFSAAQGDETAHQLEDKHHGLFTYCLLKELQKAQGDINLGTLTDNVTKQVKRQSVVINNKKQTPTVIPSQKMMNDWREMKLK